jgi:trehalose 6-phosphate phosphatase
VTDTLSAAAAQARRSLLADPASALLAFDFDGTLAPITDDPADAHAHPDVMRVLARLGHRVGQLAVITGRPVEAVRRLGAFEGLDGLGRLVVLGQYGYERWDAATDELVSPPPPDAIEQVRAELPGVLAALGLEQAYVEEKGRAVGVHVRRLPDPAAAFDALLEPLAGLARAHGLTVEPGRHVIEIRGRGMDKGIALRGLVEETGARTVVFAGDDLGDLPAFETVDALRAEGLAGLTVCSASAETEVAAHTDLSVDGPDGVVAWLRELADALDAAGV